MTERIFMLFIAGGGCAAAGLYAWYIDYIRKNIANTRVGFAVVAVGIFLVVTGVPIIQMMTSNWLHSDRHHGDPFLIYLFIAQQFVAVFVLFGVLWLRKRNQGQSTRSGSTGD